MHMIDEIRALVTSVLGRLGWSGTRAAVKLVIVLLTSAVSIVGGIALTGAVLVRLPPDYLVDDAPPSRRRRPFRERVRRFGRHALGVLLILLGIVMALPGVPGPGILTILAGLYISEIPGARALLRRILRSPK